MSGEHTFAYRGRRADGEAVSSVIRAPDRRSALLRLESDGIVPLSLNVQEDGAPLLRLRQHRDEAGDRLLVLQQIAVLTGAGIPLLEAVESVAAALTDRAISVRLLGTATALRRGDSIAGAFEAGLQGYPAHVYALIRVGETNGNLAMVLEEAVRQLRFAQALRRDVLNALAYPAFLVIAAASAFAFLFTVVVPRFAEMIGPARTDIGGLSRFILDLGAIFHANPLALPLIASGVVLAVWWTTMTPEGRGQAAHVLSELPGFGGLVIAGHRAAWARLMALAVNSGVGILDAAALSFEAAPAGRFRDRLSGSVGALRAGRPVAEAFGASGALDAIDRSLLHTGQAAGKLGAMFTVIADRHEEDLRSAMKRGTALLEQAAVALVALVIGAVVLGLVGAMTSVYESIG